MRFLPPVSKVGNFLDRWPSLWHAVQVARYRNSRVLSRFVTPEHDLVLEGFPRSGNSFAARAFVSANPRAQSWVIATHGHRIAQLALAIRYKLPTAVFVRNPQDAVTSLAALRFPNASPASGPVERFIAEKTTYYARFHEFIASHADNLVISGFGTTTGDFGRVVDALNTRFGTEFSRFESNPSNIEAIFHSSGKHLSPDLSRQRIRNKYLECYLSDSNRIGRERAERAFALVSESAI